MDTRQNTGTEVQEACEDPAALAGTAVSKHVMALSRPQMVTLIVNVGLFLSLVLSVVALLPFRWPLVDQVHLRLFSSIAVVVFLDMSFWLAGWPGSALGITLLGLALVFTAAVGQQLGLVGAVLSFLAGFAGLLLMSSDLPFLKDGEWVSRGNLIICIGLLANLIVAVLSFLLWLTFGTA